MALGVAKLLMLSHVRLRAPYPRRQLSSQRWTRPGYMNWIVSCCAQSAFQI
jgi:hypothetical protein